jgi:hypothetical protein
MLDPRDVLTFHNDNSRSGANTNETILNTSNVNSTQFGRLFHYAVDGYVYAQPLYKYGQPLADGSTHNVVFIATEHDSVYAFDADSPAKNGPSGYLWKASFINPANRITTVPYQEVNTPDIVPEIGITGTPVIDAATDTLYVVAKTKEIRTEGSQDVTHYVFKLHALDTRSGADKAVVTIGDTTLVGGLYNNVTTVAVPGTGADSNGGIVRFDALREHQRPGLALDHGMVYVSFASHGDNGPYHGWIVAYSALTGGGSGLSQLAVFNTSPDGGLDGIWQSGGAPSIDQNGNLIFSTGNGTFDKGLAGPNALGPTGGGLGYGGDFAASASNPNPGVFYSAIPPITKSLAVKFDSFKSRPGETDISNSTGVYVSGHEPRNINLQQGDLYQDLTGTGIDFLAGQHDTPHVFQVTLNYDGRSAGQEVLTETIVDQTALTSYSRNYYVNLSQYVGGDNAYVGFTAGTGGHNGKMDVLGWNYTDQLMGQTINLGDRANLQLNGSASFVGTTAQLTDGGAGFGGQGEAGSVFSKQRVNEKWFTTTFTFQMLPGTVSPPADGLTFTVQNAPGGPNGREVGESVVKVNPNQLQQDKEMTLTDYFTPFNWRELNINDNDLGSGAVMLLPDEVGNTTHPHLAVETGKTGQIYLIDRDNMGGYVSQGPNGNLQTVVLGGPGVWASPAYWNHLIFYQGSNTVVKSYSIADGVMSSDPASFAGGGPDADHPVRSWELYPFPGAQPSISANGNDPATGIVWTIDSSLRGERSALGPAFLRAFKATDLSQSLWASDRLDPNLPLNQQLPSQRDQAGNAVKFIVPTITNGHVYIGTQFEVDVFGLFPPETLQPPLVIQGLTGKALSPTSLQISWQPDGSGMYYRATGFNIYRATNPDLSDATLVSQVGRDVTTYTDTGLKSATAYYYYLITTNQFGTSPPSVIVGIRTQIAPAVVSVPDVCPNAVTISWTGTADDHYDIYRKAPGQNNFSLLITLPATQKTYTNNGLAFGNYAYFVRTANQSGDFADSNPIGATVGPVNLDFSGGFPDQPSDLLKNGSTSFGGGEITLTNDINQAGSAWETTRVGIRNFTAEFEFQFREGSVPRADGFMFVLQADPRGITALGPQGGGLGYGADTPGTYPTIAAGAVLNSIGIKFDIYSNAGEGTNSTGLFTGGRSPTVRQPGLPNDFPDISVNLDGTGITLNSQSPKMVMLMYDGTTLTETIVDEGTQQKYTTTYTVNIMRFIGNETAYVGFTGGTGGNWTIQSIKTLTYAEHEENLPPRTPSNLRQIGDVDVAATLQWNCNNDYTAQGYYIERSTSPTGGFVQVGKVDDPNTNTFADNPGQPGVYYYRVQSFNGALVSGYSNTILAYYQVPAPPTNLRSPHVGAGSVDLIWQVNSTNQTGFAIERSTSPTSGFQVIDTVAADQNTYTDFEVGNEAPGAYYYRVRAIKGTYSSDPTNVVRANVAPNPFTDHQDIGAVVIAGDAHYDNGVYTVQGDGSDIADPADAFHYFYMGMFSGNGEIVARVLSVQNTDPGAKAGVMIRETLAADSRHALMSVTPGGAVLRARSNVQITYGDPNIKAPYWVRLVRGGSKHDEITAYESADGIIWVQLAPPIVLTNLAATVYVGLAVTSHNAGQLNTSMFDNVLVVDGAATPKQGLGISQGTVAAPSVASSGYLGIGGETASFTFVGMAQPGALGAGSPVVTSSPPELSPPLGLADDTASQQAVQELATEFGVVGMTQPDALGAGSRFVAGSAPELSPPLGLADGTASQQAARDLAMAPGLPAGLASAGSGHHTLADLAFAEFGTDWIGDALLSGLGVVV